MENHFAVATMKKFKSDNLSGILQHDFRTHDHHSNQDIDTNLSYQNVELVAEKKISKKDVLDYINRKKTSKRKVRKDAVVLDEWIISSDNDYFKGLTADQTKNYFKTAVDYFGSEFGRSNIMYASVHLDETTPHMHMGIVPMTKDGRLSSKQVFDRDTLRRIQSDFPKYMQNHGFDVVRGSEKSQRKKLSVPEFKHTKDEAIKAILSLSKDFTDFQPGGIRAGDHYLAKESEHERNYKFLATRSLQQLLDFIQQIIKLFTQQIAKRREKLAEREKAVKAQEDEIKRKTADISSRESTLDQKEQLYKQFQSEYRTPNKFAKGQFYLRQVNAGVVQPVQKLQKGLQSIDDAHEIDQIINSVDATKGHERKHHRGL